MEKKEMRIGLYARVSTSDKGQDVNLQLNPLRQYCQHREGWNVTGEYVDIGISGTKNSRPEFDRLLDDARKRRIDVIAVWRLDRFGRSLRNLVNTLTELQELGVSFVSYSENLDFTSSTGKLLVHILASFSQFEADIIADRVRAGIKNARAKGKRIGKAPIAPYLVEKIRELRKTGASIRVIAGKLNLSVGVVHKTLSNPAPEVSV